MTGSAAAVQDGYEATQGYRMEIPLDNDALDRALDAMEVAGPSGFSVSYIVREGRGIRLRRDASQSWMPSPRRSPSPMPQV